MNISKDNKELKAETVTTTNQKDEEVIQINREDNQRLFLELINKLEQPIFTKIKKNKSEELRNVAYDKFVELSTEEQCKQIFEVLNMMTNMKTTYDIAALGIKMARLMVNANITKAEEFVIINESITGLFVSEVKII